MTKRPCKRATSLLASRGSGLTEAQRLELEHHLEHCASCAIDELHVQRLVHYTGAAALPGLGERARGRAIAGALLQRATGAGAAGQRPVRSAWNRLLIPAGVALAGAAAVALFVVKTGSGSDGAAPVATAAPAVPSGVDIDAPKDSEMVVGHAELTFDAPSTVVWDEATSTVWLRKGVVIASVDPGPRRPFRVATSHFSVEVLGTVFEVTPESVYVMEGKVRVLSPDGEVFADEIAAGESWFKPMIASNGRSRRAKRTPSKSVDAAALLDSARAHLAAGDVDDARSNIDAALAARPGRAVTAEARTLLAEAALVAGNQRQAVRLYLEVAEQYRKLRAGENALFAAARLEARSNADGKARKLLQKYLDRYPDGRFVDEATQRLANLD
jgi:hypothetical protein